MLCDVKKIKRISKELGGSVYCIDRRMFQFQAIIFFSDITLIIKKKITKNKSNYLISCLVANNNAYKEFGLYSVPTSCFNAASFSKIIDFFRESKQHLAIFDGHDVIALRTEYYYAE